MRMLGPEAEARLDWLALTDAIRDAHRLPRAEIRDSLIRRGGDTLLTRSAWIDGLGLLVKAATIFPGNAALSLPAVNGGASLFSDRDGRLEAMVDFHLLTKWKTAGDSLLAARLLARPDSETFLLVGAGTVARAMVLAYRALFPKARFLVAGRSAARLDDFAKSTGARVVSLDDGIAAADIICCATMATAPLIQGAQLREGQHLDLIGAYRPDMREADDLALQKARIFVDSRATTIEHIGELKDPIARGVIAASDVLADYYDIDAGLFARRSATEITLFKNGGGAHLDLMTARHILERQALN